MLNRTFRRHFLNWSKHEEEEIREIFDDLAKEETNYISYLHFNESRFTMLQTTGRDFPQARRHIILQPAKQNEREHRLFVRQLLKDLPHATLLSASEIAGAAHQWWEITDEPQDKLPSTGWPSQQSLEDIPLLITDALSAGQYHSGARPASRYEKIDEGLAESLIKRSTTTPTTWRIRHKPTAEYLSEKLGTPIPHDSSPLILSTTFNPMILLYRTSALIRFTEILQPEDLAAHDDQWWLISN